ncbi:hypothetical protein [Haloferula sp.]|uniref:hypothetical protein n=1 Tax=Haloferula sp. TaxID=2497595 RepID=UPI00329F1B72
MNRSFIFTSTALLLVICTWFLWQRRFAPEKQAANLDLKSIVEANESSLRPGVRWESGHLVLETSADHPQVVQRLRLPGIGSVDQLHFRIRVVADRLEVGTNRWEDGRLLIEWHSQNSTDDIQTEYLTSAGYNDPNAVSSCVARPKIAPAVPALRIEHLGRSGIFRVEQCDVIAVRETSWWTSGKVLLIAAWLVWSSALIKTDNKRSLRPWLTAALWVFLVAQLIIPGPWALIRPLGQSFEFLPKNLPVSTSRSEIPVDINLNDVPESMAPLGKLPESGSLILQIKNHIKQSRPLLHFLLFFGVTLALAFAAGNRSILPLSVMLAVGKELAQLGFRYGSDYVDLLDLLCDSLGIALALVIFTKLKPTRWGRLIAPETT